MRNLFYSLKFGLNQTSNIDDFNNFNCWIIFKSWQLKDFIFHSNYYASFRHLGPEKEYYTTHLVYTTQAE